MNTKEVYKRYVLYPHLKKMKKQHYRGKTEDCK